MLTSIAVILLLGLLMSRIFTKLKLPGLLGMIIVGIIISPHALNLIDESILITAPFGAICVDRLYQRLLQKE